MMEMDEGDTDDSATEFSQVPKRLMYNPPRKEDFLSRSTSSDWREGLRDVLLSVEVSIQNNEDNPLVLFQNDKYVCTYDMVSSHLFLFATVCVICFWYFYICTMQTNIIFMAAQYTFI